MLGIYVGLTYDASGVKLSEIIPARVLRAALEDSSAIATAPASGP